MIKKHLWPLLGIAAMLLSIRVLYVKLSHISFEDVIFRLASLNFSHWLLAIISSLIAYMALAGYDRIALEHLHKKISWFFIALCSFTTYALSHSFGMSVFSGAIVRYRAYSTKGLTGPEITILVAFCSFTFVLGTVTLSAICLLLRPDLINLIPIDIPEAFATLIGCILFSFILLYIFGSWLQLPPLKIGSKFQIVYPSLPIVAKQLIIAPLELLGAAGIIYAVLPQANNPGFIMVLGVFLASFTITLLSNAPAGGVGVLEAVFMAGMPEMNPTDVIAALIVFRLLYLIIPLFLSLFIVSIFEISLWRQNIPKPHHNPIKINHTD